MPNRKRLQKRSQTIILDGDAAILIPPSQNASFTVKGLNDKRRRALQVIVQPLIKAALASHSPADVRYAPLWVVNNVDAV